MGHYIYTFVVSFCELLCFLFGSMLIQAVELKNYTKLTCKLKDNWNSSARVSVVGLSAHPFPPKGKTTNLEIMHWFFLMGLSHIQFYLKDARAYDGSNCNDPA